MFVLKDKEHTDGIMTVDRRDILSGYKKYQITATYNRMAPVLVPIANKLCTGS